MTVGLPIHALWPEPSPGPVDDDALTALYRRADRPHLRMNFVTSVDGAVSLDDYSAGLSGEPDKRVFGLLRMLCDALLVAAGTLRHEGYRAIRLDERRRAWRRRHGLTEYPTLVVVSASGRLDPEQAAFADAPVRPLVLTRSDAVPPTGLSTVADVVPCGDDRVDLVAGLAEMRRRGLDQVLCEGGPHLFGALTADDLVDEVCLSVAPLLAGAGAGRITAGDPSPARHLPLRHVLHAADGTLLLRYARG
ncbi:MULTISPECIES: pyrimidine reductase family protein [unclassified Micromonospora]|uniref:pyrimidine reductase family protein n=1 Tax=unclassified Micromonospora TaxID=2617518 RepID=UPI0010340AF3|nr:MULTISPECIES: pyrimidine reductase family protein [unclassified Micromonospora]QKW12941.1 pyrimidine reductase family protein [Verrucosispora sp. NA02020]TBL42188.1 pyrimidine reductase family protein [Verrucosispora sp. SN26_14.1]